MLNITVYEPGDIIVLATEGLGHPESFQYHINVEGRLEEVDMETAHAYQTYHKGKVSPQEVSLSATYSAMPQMGDDISDVEMSEHQICRFCRKPIKMLDHMWRHVLGNRVFCRAQDSGVYNLTSARP